jgi:alkyl sulfatase BDS1-like metallo-beta-lactamase superfamily hydrolase
MGEPLYRSRPGAPYPAKLGVQEINDFVYLSEGLSNSFMLLTDEGRILINTGMGMEAPIHKKNFDSVSTAPTRYIILTQGHVDHVGGVEYLREEGTLVIAQAGNAEHQAYDKRLAPFRGSRSAFAFREPLGELLAYVQREVGPPPPQAIPTPDITFEDRYAFSLGGLRVELLGIPGGETNDSLVVWLPDQRICFPGNLFGCLFGHFPNLVTIRGDRYRDALTVAAAVARVRDLDPEHLMVGHHQPISGKALIREELDRLHGAILYVHDAVVEGMNAGSDVRTLMREIQLPEELEVGQGYGTVPWSVRAIWEHYAGWFHHESTTELYPVAPRDVDRDWIDLAGPDAIVGRARERFERGEPVQALHLLDVLLSQPDAPPEAVALAVEVHQKLLEESVNFWLSAWLSEQIRLLEARRAAS